MRTWLITLLILLGASNKTLAACDTIPDSYDSCLLEINYEIIGTVAEYGGLSRMPTDSIWKCEYIDMEFAYPVYKEKANYGLVAIITKSMAKKMFSQSPGKLSNIPVDMSINIPSAETDTSSDKVFYKVEVEAEFPGGNAGWAKYIQKEIEKHISELSDCRDCSGVCTVSFIVEINGAIRDVTAETMKGTKLAEIVVNAVKKGPKWKPAYLNGRPVTAYRRQNITFNGTE